jgi:hypothetical protein
MRTLLLELELGLGLALLGCGSLAPTESLVDASMSGTDASMLDASMLDASMLDASMLDASSLDAEDAPQPVDASSDAPASHAMCACDFGPTSCLEGLDAPTCEGLAANCPGGSKTACTLDSLAWCTTSTTVQYHGFVREDGVLDAFAANCRLVGGELSVWVPPMPTGSSCACLETSVCKRAFGPACESLTCSGTTQAQCADPGPGRCVSRTGQIEWAFPGASAQSAESACNAAEVELYWISVSE